MARTRPRLGLRHPTVVPTNFEPEGSEPPRETDADRFGRPPAPARSRPTDD